MLINLNISVFVKISDLILIISVSNIGNPQKHDDIYNLYTFLYKKIAIFHEKIFL